MRTHCADALYTALLTAEALGPEAFAAGDMAFDFLASTAVVSLVSCVSAGADVDSAGIALASASWSGGIAEVKAARAEVASALKIELPVAAAVVVKKATNVSQEKGEGYGTLVRDMGY